MGAKANDRRERNRESLATSIGRGGLNQPSKQSCANAPSGPDGHCGMLLWKWRGSVSSADSSLLLRKIGSGQNEVGKLLLRRGR